MGEKDVPIPLFMSMNLIYSIEYDVDIKQAVSAKEYRILRKCSPTIRYIFPKTKLSWDNFIQLKTFFIKCQGQYGTFFMPDFSEPEESDEESHQSLDFRAVKKVAVRFEKKNLTYSKDSQGFFLVESFSFVQVHTSDN